MDVGELSVIMRRRVSDRTDIQKSARTTRPERITWRESNYNTEWKVCRSFEVGAKLLDEHPLEITGQFRGGIEGRHRHFYRGRD